MAGTIIVSSIKTDTDNSFIVRSNTGATLFSVDTTSISIPDGSITSAMIANGTVIAADILDGTITAAKLAPGAALPSQTSNATYYLTSDGTNAIWKAQTALTVANTQITGNITSSQITSIQSSSLPVGSVLQVVSNTSQSAQATTSSATYVTTGFSASITPSSASNKVLVLLSALGRNGSGGAQAFYTMYRGATDLASTRSFKQLYNPSAGVLDGAIDMSILDSPSSTSSVTYTIYFKGAATTYFGLDNSMVSLTLMEIKG